MKKKTRMKMSKSDWDDFLNDVLDLCGGSSADIKNKSVYEWQSLADALNKHTRWGVYHANATIWKQRILSMLTRRDDKYIIFNNNIKILLIKTNMTQTDFGTKLGISRSSVTNKLNGVQYWKTDDVNNISKVFNIPYHKLMHDKLSYTDTPFNATSEMGYDISKHYSKSIRSTTEPVQLNLPGFDEKIKIVNDMELLKKVCKIIVKKSRQNQGLTKEQCADIASLIEDHSDAILDKI